MKNVLAVTIIAVLFAGSCPIVQAKDHGTPGEGKVRVRVVGGVIEPGYYWVDAVDGLKQIAEHDPYTAKAPRIIPGIIHDTLIHRGNKTFLYRPDKPEGDIYTAKLQEGDDIKFPDLCGF